MIYMMQNEQIQNFDYSNQAYDTAHCFTYPQE